MMKAGQTAPKTAQADTLRGARTAPTPTYRASDGYELHYRHWKTDLARPRGMIVGVHGIQSHSGWYAYSCSRLAEAGYDVFFLDRRGSGLNAERRGHAVHEDRLVNDVAQFLSELRRRQRKQRHHCPLVLMGVSWGGKLATMVGCRRPDLVDGLALLYPGLYSRIKPTRWQRFKLWMAVQRDWGRFHIPIPLNEPELFTDEPRWREFIRQDPLALHQVTVSFLAANLRMTTYLERNVSRLEMPVLMMLAGRDRIIDNAATKRMFERMGSARKTFVEYPEACHTLEFEPKPEQFIDDLLAWLDGMRDEA
jgi:alpha-beta hydrolase superfamily lysophospholipase